MLQIKKKYTSTPKLQSNSTFLQLHTANGRFVPQRPSWVVCPPTAVAHLFWSRKSDNAQGHAKQRLLPPLHSPLAPRDHHIQTNRSLWHLFCVDIFFLSLCLHARIISVFGLRRVGVVSNHTGAMRMCPQDARNPVSVRRHWRLFNSGLAPI
jgi:hypothetical protein